MSQKTFRYPTPEFNIVWKPDVCVHSGLCARGLSEVFKPKNLPWIDPTGATAARIREQIGQCPSQALTIEPLPSKP